MPLTPKERMKIERQEMPEREPEVRNRDFDEVNLGFPEKVAILEVRDTKTLELFSRHS